MNIFKKLDGLFFHSFLCRLEEKKFFLEELKKRNMSVDDGIKVVKQLIEAEKYDIIV